MDLRDLVRALLSYEALEARQWVADSLRQGIVWSSIPEPADLDAVSKALSARGWTVATMRLGWRAKNPMKLDDAAARTEVEQFLAEIDEDDDVQHIYVGLDA